MLSFLSRYKFYSILLGVVIAVLFLVFLVSVGYYPIALVNSQFVSAKRFAREYAATDFYYQSMLKTYGDKAFGDTSITPVDLTVSAMEKIVEDILIQNEARREVGSDLDSLVQNKLDGFGSDEELKKAASGLYGLNKNDFWSMVLIPQAERDVLSGRLFIKGQKIEDWIIEAKKSAKVLIFSNQLRWSGDKVVASGSQ